MSLFNGANVDWTEAAFRTFISTGGLGRLVGFWQCCCNAAFSYSGVEMIGIAAHETEDPRHTLPPAVRRVSHRIILYYVGAILALGLNVSVLDPILRNDVETGSSLSPFILLLQRAGIDCLSSVVNAGALISAISVGAINLYISVKFPHSLINAQRAGHFMH